MVSEPEHSEGTWNKDGAVTVSWDLSVGMGLQPGNQSIMRGILSLVSASSCTPGLSHSSPLSFHRLSYSFSYSPPPSPILLFPSQWVFSTVHPHREIWSYQHSWLSRTHLPIYRELASWIHLQSMWGETLNGPGVYTWSNLKTKKARGRGSLRCMWREYSSKTSTVRPNHSKLSSDVKSVSITGSHLSIWNWLCDCPTSLTIMM